MSFDEPTQQLRRPDVSPPMPGPLDQTRPRPEGGPNDDESTGVLPLDELLGPPETAEADTESASPDVASPPAAAQAPAARAPMPVVPVRSSQPNAPTRQPATGRLKADAATVLRGGGDHVLAWLRRDDNALTVVTALVAILLLSVIAAVGS